MERAQLASLIARHIIAGARLPSEGEGLLGGLQNLGGDWLVTTREPAQFRSAFALACSAGTGRVILCDPSWGPRERTQLSSLLSRSRASAERGWLCIPTGGSSGQLKLARHDGHTVAAACEAYRTFFGITHPVALGLLPLHHVSGFMAWLRCELGGGRMVDATWAAVEAGELPEVEEGMVISLVPTQLQRLLRSARAADWLRRFSIVFLGGAPAWTSLLDAARTAGLRVALSYGMTETAAMVAALPPDEFLSGATGAGRPMPHVTLSIDSEGLVIADGASLFFGYAGSPERVGPFETEDLGALGSDGILRIEGRRDAMIISGGKKIAPAEVEAAILAGGLVDEVAVTGLPDAEWGQAVCVCVPASVSKESIAAAALALEGELAPWKQPKRWIQLANWPRDEKGKVNHAMLRMQLRPFLWPVVCGCDPKARQ